MPRAVEYAKARGIGIIYNHMGYDYIEKEMYKYLWSIYTTQ